MLLRKYPTQDEFHKLALKHNVIPVCCELLADTETPVSLLQRFFTDGSPCFLLESVEDANRWGRYSFLGISAREMVRIFTDCVEVEQRTGEKQRIVHNNDPLAVLREYSGKFNEAELPDLPRFCGGLVGVLQYELVSFFEPRVPNLLPEEEPLSTLMVPDVLMLFDNVRNTITCVVLAFLEKDSNPAAEYATAVQTLEKLMEQLEQPMQKPPAILQEQTEADEDEDDEVRYELHSVLSPEHFRKMVRKVKKEIVAGEVIQTVISQPFTCRAPADPISLYRAQRYVNPSPYLFFVHTGEATLIGSSPETMVQIEGRTARLRPIAGTRPRGADPKADRLLADELLRDEKEKAEHLMLVDLGRNDLGRVAQTGTVQVNELMAVERYSHVMHLVSDVTAELRDDCDAYDLLRATFPAGTLSGAPKVRAMQLIAELEEQPRGLYGGAVGYIGFNGNLDLAITIRSAAIRDGVVKVQAGAGIVADSDPESERMETINKAGALQKALALL